MKKIGCYLLQNVDHSEIIRCDFIIASLTRIVNFYELHTLV